jgi:hypothetical protein
MYNNPFNIYNQQMSLDRLNEQINHLEKMKSQLQQPQPTNLTQNFQLAPTSRDVIRYASSLEEVQRDTVIGDTPYFSKDMSIVWIKNVKGEIKTYELIEIIPKDEKDMQIEMLQEQINELKKGMVTNEQFSTDAIPTEDATDTTRNDEKVGTTTKSEKSASVQRVQTSKKK